MTLQNGPLRCFHCEQFKELDDEECLKTLKAILQHNVLRVKICFKVKFMLEPTMKDQAKQNQCLCSSCDSTHTIAKPQS